MLRILQHILNYQTCPTSSPVVYTNKRTQMMTCHLIIFLKSNVQLLKGRFKFFPLLLQPTMLQVTSLALEGCLGRGFMQLNLGKRDLDDIIQFFYQVTLILKVFKVCLLLKCDYFFQLHIERILQQ